ncbi:MAG: phage N-6-adenine-methyltransferase [bacterium]|nr:phage N-6-adenine-methyltransferase [bacterium]
MTGFLVHFDAARAALESAVRVDEVKAIRDKAQAAQAYARQAKLSLVMQNQCAEIRLRAERKLGELLSKTIRHEGGRPKRSRAGTVSKETLGSLGVGKNQSARWQRVAAVPERTFKSYLSKAFEDGDGEEVTTAGLLRFAGRRAAVSAMASSETYEWYTPGRYVHAARFAMGGIDLDPASSAEANKTVKAARFLSVEEGGLEQVWAGRVWLNPPYGRSGDSESNQAVWSSSLGDRVDRREVDQAVLLVNAATSAKWFQPLWERVICFVDHRIRFERPGGEPGPQPTHGNVFVYFGEKASSFAEQFSEFGRIVKPAAGCSVGFRKA